MPLDTRRGGGTAVVTGASSGIGAVYTRRLVEQGWHVVAVARRAERLQRLAEALAGGSGAVETLPADLARPDDLAHVVERVAAPGVGLLVNNAGINGYGAFPQTDPALLARVLAVNVTAPTMLARAVLPGMLERGRGGIVNVASLLAFAGALPPEPLPRRAVYGGSKGYLVTFTRTLAAEFAESPVTAQVLCPGLTATEFHLTQGADSVPGLEERVHASGGMDPEDVVRASLTALRSGETVCVPGLADPAALHRLIDVEAEIRGAAGAGLAARYADHHDDGTTDAAPAG